MAEARRIESRLTDSLALKAKRNAD
jgi:hypothetical protein